MIDTSLLNDNQKEAVLSDDKYLRIIAGAGSGKTRVLTMRIAHLVEDEDVRPYKILAITFTNKAANEMKQRIAKMLDDDSHGTPWISTIHSLCVRILREDISFMGFPRNFTIMDADDQKSLVRQALKKLDERNLGLTPSYVIDYISRTKAEDVSPEDALKRAGNFPEDQLKAKVYGYYLQQQKAMFALDFDDLILWTVRMFSRFPEVLKKWQNHFECVLVDEFQDIDNLQYKLIRYLTGQNSCLYVVGDPDQTIYTWRGANVDIIMHFEKDYPGTRSIILNRNYRSTLPILEAANSVIVNNKNRMKKDLVTDKKSDDKVVHYSATSDEYEAAWVAGRIAELHKKGKPYKDMAILYRSNYLSRSLEKGLIDQRIPYVIYGGVRFYSRQEIKDLMCYLRMITGGDDLAFERVINQPKRGIGPKTINTLAEYAQDDDTTMYEALKAHLDSFSGKTKTNLTLFISMVEKWRVHLQKFAISDLFNEILEDSGYRTMLAADKEKGEERMENVKTLLADINSYYETNEDATLDLYLQEAALYSDSESEAPAERDYVTLMTVHAAKGLEFDTVFVTDLSDGIFPNERAMSEGNRGVEEERRLAYVAFTRAQNHLFLTDAGGFSFILQKLKTPSRFIREIDPQWLEEVNQQERRMSAAEALGRFSSSSFSGFHNDEEDKPHFVQRPAVSLTNAQAKSGSGLKKGDKVSHVKFGEGIVIKVGGGIAEIAFPYPYGIKKIAAGHPSLKKVK